MQFIAARENTFATDVQTNTEQFVDACACYIQAKAYQEGKEFCND